MATATHSDIRRLVPEIEDHAVVEIIGMRATVAEIEAALAELSSEGEDLLDIEQREGDRLHHLLGILSRSNIEAESGREH